MNVSGETGLSGMRWTSARRFFLMCNKLGSTRLNWPQIHLLSTHGFLFAPSPDDPSRDPARRHARRGAGRRPRPGAVRGGDRAPVVLEPVLPELDRRLTRLDQARSARVG